MEDEDAAEAHQAAIHTVGASRSGEARSSLGRPEVGRQPADAAHGLVGPLPGVGEPEGLRRLVEGGVVLPREVGGDHSGAPLLRAGTARGFGGCAPSVRCFGSGARGRGFEGGAQPPLASQVCTHTGYAGPAALAGGQPTVFNTV